MKAGLVLAIVMLLIVMALVVAYRWRARTRLRSLQAAKSTVIEVAQEVRMTAETIRRRRYIEAIEAGAGRLLHGEPLPDLAGFAELWSLRACRAATGNGTSMPGPLSTLVPQLLLAADSVLGDLKRLSGEHQGQARPEFLGELLTMSCAFLEVSDHLVSEVGLLYPGVVIPTGSPGEMEQMYRSNLGGSSIPTLIKVREVEAAIALDLHGAGRAIGSSVRGLPDA